MRHTLPWHSLKRLKPARKPQAGRPKANSCAVAAVGTSAISTQLQCEVHNKNRGAGNLMQEPNPLTQWATMRWVCKPGMKCKGAVALAPLAAAEMNAEETVAAAEDEILEIPPRSPPAQKEETCVWLLQRCRYVCKMTPQVCASRWNRQILRRVSTPSLAMTCFSLN